MLTVWNWTELEAELAEVCWDDALGDTEDLDIEDKNWNTDGKRRAAMTGKWAGMPRKLDACEGYTSCVSFYLSH